MSDDSYSNKTVAELFEERVNIPAAKIAKMLCWAPGAEDMARKLGVDPDDTLEYAQAGIHYFSEEHFLSEFQDYCREQGLKFRNIG